MNGFQKRVALLEKWAPNLLPKVKDLDDLADIIYDTWLEAEADTEQRIIKLLEEDAGDWHETVKRCEGGFCHCDAIALIKGEK